MPERTVLHRYKTNKILLPLLLLLLVAFVLPMPSSLQASRQLPLSAEATASTVDEVALSRLLYQDCGSCHGMHLTGGLGPDITPARMAAMPRDWITQTISEGRPGTAMPPWGPLLSRAEIEWLVTTLQTGSTP